MITCKEHDLSKIARIDAYVTGSLNYGCPVFVVNPAVPSDQLFNGMPPSMPVSFSGDSVKCVEKTNVSYAGYTHEVSLSWETQALTESDYDGLLTLQLTPHDFVITYFGGVQRVIRTDSTAYRFIFDDDNGTMKCAATLVNGQGLTLVTR